MLVNDFSWTELSTDDPAAAAEFYAALFEWNLDHQQCEAGAYYELKPNSEACGGITAKREPSVPAAWMPYVTVGDLDATLSKASELGGQCVVPRTELPGGAVFAVLVDPQGARIGVFQQTAVPSGA